MHIAAIVVILLSPFHPPTSRVPVSIVPPYGSWSVVNAMEFVGRQEAVLHVCSFSTIDAVPGNKFPLRLEGLKPR